MRTYAVIGMGFGDEGKGKVVDYLVNKQEDKSKVIVARFSGGPQAAHQVVLEDGREHVFSSFGSGTFRDVPTYYTRHCLVNPISLMNEYDILLNKKVLSPRIFINSDCPVITPYEIIWNKESKEKSNGTCGSGIYATVRREQQGFHFIFSDLLNKKITKIKLDQLKYFYEDLEEKPSEESIKDFLISINDMIKNKITICVDNIPYFNKIIYEGSQGLLLDQNYGFYPNVTPSNTGLTNISPEINEIWLVSRAYQTRHGNGPMSKIIDNNIKENPYEKNFTNSNQGEFRKTILDLDLLKYARNIDLRIRDKHSNINIVINCMDLIEEDYRMFSNQRIYNCKNKNSFLQKIKEEFKYTNIYHSSSPISKNIELFK